MLWFGVEACVSVSSSSGLVRPSGSEAVAVLRPAVVSSSAFCVSFSCIAVKPDCLFFIEIHGRVDNFFEIARTALLVLEGADTFS